jgi:nucleotide-binding universal stress UspA family protein
MRILLAIDTSKFSEAAARAVQARAQPPGAEVHVVHVIVPHSSATLPRRKRSRPEPSHAMPRARWRL